MTVLIKRHDIICHLDGKQLDTPLKLTITTFQVKDGLLRVEKHCIIEIDDEVKYFYLIQLSYLQFLYFYFHHYLICILAITLFRMYLK